MKKAFFMAIFLVFCSSKLLSQNEFESIDTTKYYSFHVNYWFNMHHFLWIESFLNTGQDSTLILNKLSSEDRNQLDSTLIYYKETLLKEDLRSSEYMSGFKNWITGKKVDLKNIPEAFTEQMSVLIEFDEVYKKIFWPDHQRVCKAVLYENLELIKKTEDSFVKRITKLTRQYWDFEKIRVDITIYAKSDKWNLRNRPYTSLFPTHVVMNAIGENEVKGNWIELLFHESAHHLILGSSYFVAGTIKDFVEVKGIKSPRQLGHAYLFYLTGKIAQDLLFEQGIDYPEIYMVRNKVFYKYYPLLEKYLGQYMDRKITLAEATERFIADLNK